MSASTRTFLALAAGLTVGAILRAVAAPAVVGAVLAVAEPVGTVWVNAIRMTVVPLVVSLLVGAVATADARTVGRLGARAALVFLLSLAAGATLVSLVAPSLVARIPVPPPEAIRALHDVPTSLAAAAPVSVRDWIVALVPTNPVKAAADGALLPLVLFTLLFAAAATRIADASRTALVDVFRAIGDALLVVVRWVLALAPIGVFALALVLGARAGGAAAQALAGYIVLTIALCLVVIVGMTLGASAFGRVPLRRLLRAAAPGQAVALGTRSSLAALPAMIRGVDTHSRSPPRRRRCCCRWRSRRSGSR